MLYLYIIIYYILTSLHKCADSYPNWPQTAAGYKISQLYPRTALLLKEVRIFYCRWIDVNSPVTGFTLANKNRCNRFGEQNKYHVLTSSSSIIITTFTHFHDFPLNCFNPFLIPRLLVRLLACGWLYLLLQMFSRFFLLWQTVTNGEELCGFRGSNMTQSSLFSG